MDLSQWGIEKGFFDTEGNWVEPPEQVLQQIVSQLSHNRQNPPDPSEVGLWVVHDDQTIPLDGTWELILENQSSIIVKDQIGPNLPLGYHWLKNTSNQSSIRLIVTPTKCYLPLLYDWGWSMQLYSMRSNSSWGIGDLGDLDSFASFGASNGSNFVLVNPLHAALPIGTQQPSPYYPSSRCFKNPIYINMDDIRNSFGSQDIDEIEQLAKELNLESKINRDRVFELKMQALEKFWANFQGNENFDQYRIEQGPLLTKYAAFCVLSETYGYISSWPEQYKDPNSDQVSQFCKQNKDRIAFHSWLQWILDYQLEKASKHLSVVNDLAVGVDPAGADAWIWKDCFASNISTGAPPDAFNPNGQNWGFPPFDPYKLRESHFEPYIAMLKLAMSHVSGLRIDHVLGLFRLFWIPASSKDGQGSYVRYPWQEMLDILALESVRNQTWIVGEDLGTVEPFVRDELFARNILSYKVAWFEPEPPINMPQRCLGSLSTHDLPTIGGLWTKKDLQAQLDIGMNPNIEFNEEIRNKLSRWTGLGFDADLDQVIIKAYELLAKSKSMLVVASLEDGLKVIDRPNMPGTTFEWPNWSLALPKSLEDIKKDQLILDIFKLFNSRNS